MKGLNKYLEHSFSEAWIPDHVGGVEYYELCEYCGHEEGTNIKCLTKQRYEDIKKSREFARLNMEGYKAKRQKVASGRRRVRSV